MPTGRRSSHCCLPAPFRPGRLLVYPRRVIVEAILYVDRTSCAWRYLPADFPHGATVYGYFARWRHDGTLRKVHDRLRERARQVTGLYPAPSAVIESQSVRAADTVPKASQERDRPVHIR